MPEGDTIWRAAAELRRRAVGRQVTSARPAALARLTGRTLVRVESVGKHLYMHFSDGVVLHTHMRMTGAWHVYGRGERWRRASRLTTAVLGFDGLDAVLFAAPLCELIPPSAVGLGLGPDILGAGFDAGAVVSRARASARATVAEVMLDQAVCAGVGNIHRCEALWKERIDPMSPSAELDDDALERIFRRARDQMRRRVVADGFRLRRAVHGRAGRPCPRCGASIEAAPLGQPSRIVFWCPRCQRGPRSGDRVERALSARAALTPPAGPSE